MPMFRKRPVVIEARQWIGTNSDDLMEWSGGLVYYTPFSGCNVHTLEGIMRADLGDWIIRGVQGEFYPCKPDTFAETYEEAAP